MNCVIVGGYGNSTRSLEKLATICRRYFSGKVTVYTIDKALKRMDKLTLDVSGSVVITHSAGCLLMEDTHDKAYAVVAWAPPNGARKRVIVRRLLRRGYAHTVRKKQH